MQTRGRGVRAAAAWKRGGQLLLGRDVHVVLCLRAVERVCSVVAGRGDVLLFL